LTSLADAVRRTVDVLAAAILLVVTSPVIAAAAIATRMSVGRGVIYRQRRIGIGGRPFELLKFRSMRDARPGREAPEFDAERITRVGTWLRATSLDELPSLLNLLRGDIALVGPRPLPVHYWSRFRGCEYERFEVLPGITGLAQVSGRNQLDWPERLAIDVQYVRTRGLIGDARILLRTIPTVLGGGGVEQEAGVTMTELPDDRPPDDRTPRGPAPGDGRARPDRDQDQDRDRDQRRSDNSA
jgi:lipopolysaccharide/colanic/teichoic acid biosynthesis glycosyltransferase